MKICEYCMRKEYEIEENINSPFHSFTILGGISGASVTYRYIGRAQPS